MRIDALVNATAEQGFILWWDGDNVRFKGEQGMPPEQLDTLRQHKMELIAYLKLREIAGEMDWQLTDLLDWYKTPMDMADLARWDMDTVRQVVADYIQLIDLCRGEGFQPGTTLHEHNESGLLAMEGCDDKART